MIYTSGCEYILAYRDIYNPYNVEPIIKYCKQETLGLIYDSFYNLNGNIIITRNYPNIFKDVVDALKEKLPLVSELAAILYIERTWLRGTHSMKNRYIARLKKFLTILDGVYCGDMLVSLSKIYPAETRILETMVMVMEKAKEMIHRYRDRIHELLYPIIEKTLLNFTENKKIAYEIIPGNVYLVAEIEYHPSAPLKTRVKTRYELLYMKKRGEENYRTLREQEVKEILEKIEERRKTTHTRSIEKEAIWECTVNHDPWMCYYAQPYYTALNEIEFFLEAVEK